MKYLVETHCLEWHNIGYIIEANSEEEAEDFVLNGDYDEIVHDSELCDMENPDIISVERV